MDAHDFITIHYMNWKDQLGTGLWLVDFWAEWCTACSAQDNVYHDIAKTFGEDLRIGKINVGDNRMLANHFGVQNIPQLLLLKEGKTVMQMSGIQSKSQLINQIKKHIS